MFISPSTVINIKVGTTSSQEVPNVSVYKIINLNHTVTRSKYLARIS